MKFVDELNSFCLGALDQNPDGLDQLAEASPFLPDIEKSFQTLRDLGFIRPSRSVSYGNKKQECTPVHKKPPKRNFKFPEKDGYCPECGQKLIQRTGKFGKFYGCSGFPKCNYMCTIKQFDVAVNNWKRKQAIFAKYEDDDDEELETSSSEKVHTFSDNVMLKCEDCSLYSKNNDGLPYCFINNINFTVPFVQCDMFMPANKDDRLAVIEFLKKRKSKIN